MPRGRISPVMEAERNSLLTEIAEHIESELVDCGTDEDKAIAISVRVVDRVADMFGGHNITFPKDFKRRLSERDIAIYREFDGTNLKDLVNKHNMGERGMRKLLARARNRIKRKPSESKG